MAQSVQNADADSTEDIASTSANNAESSMTVQIPSLDERDFVEPRERPSTLKSSTHRIDTGYGRVYVIIGVDEDGYPFELFANIGNSGGFTNSFTESVAKMTSLALRSGVHPEEVIRMLEGIRSPKVNWDNGEKIKSIPDALATALERQIEGEFSKSEEKTDSEESSGQESANSMDRDASSSIDPSPDDDVSMCRDCGSSNVEMSEGCKTCNECGWSAC